MSIKSLAHLAQQRITSNHGSSFKRAHFYELTAAAFGYGSYAALQAESVVFDGAQPTSSEQRESRIKAVRDRARELAYLDPDADRIASQLCDVLAERGIDAIRLPELIRSLRLRTHDDAVEDDESDTESERHLPWVERWPHEDTSDDDALLCESLQAAAERGSGPAHYALALIHGADRYAERDNGLRPYWYEQRQAGVVLEGVQIEWADAWERHVTAKQAFQLHLREAARLRHPDALVDLARLFRDPTVFESDLDLSQQDPSQLAALAASLGRNADAKRWLTVAAELGETGAMRKLIEGHDAADLQRCWTWLHLAKLHGIDLTRDNYHAYHEDGSDYDDDVGGPIHVDGIDGIALEPLTPEADMLARQAAQAIFAKAKPKQ